MLLAGLFVDDTPVPADLHGLAAVALVGSDELDAAVAVPAVVPVHKRRHPQTRFLRAVIEINATGFQAVQAADVSPPEIRCRHGADAL